MRAIAASWLISGDPAEAPVPGAALVLDEQERIVACGDERALRGRFPGARWESQRAVLMPGLVNAHTHLELSGLRGQVAGGAGFGPWVERLMSARDRLSEPHASDAIEDAISELLAAGTVAIGEVSNSLAAVPALAEVPLHGCVFHEIYGLRSEVAGVMLGMAKQRRAEFAHWPQRFAYALAPHTPFSLHPDVLRTLVQDARRAGQRTSLHLCEHAAERSYLQDGSGPIAAFLAARGADAADWAPPELDPVRYVAGLGLLFPGLLCVHLTDARPDELALVAQAGAQVVLCPRSNLHIELRLPPLLQILAAGLRPALGTDSLASNASLDVLEEARALHARFPSVAPRVLLAMATSFGAEALGLQARLGRLAEGMRPGVVAFDHDGPAPTDPERFVLDPRAASRRVLAAASGAL